MAEDERVARLVQAARDLVDAYRRKATANEHFQALEQAVEGLGAPAGQQAAPPEPPASPPAE
jgi:hypothetical protein